MDTATLVRAGLGQAQRRIGKEIIERAKEMIPLVAAAYLSKDPEGRWRLSLYVNGLDDSNRSDTRSKVRSIVKDVKKANSAMENWDWEDPIIDLEPAHLDVVQGINKVLAGLPYATLTSGLAIGAPVIDSAYLYPVHNMIR